jgi:hypothetical protein
VTNRVGKGKSVSFLYSAVFASNLVCGIIPGGFLGVGGRVSVLIVGCIFPWKLCIDSCRGVSVVVY